MNISDVNNIKEWLEYRVTSQSSKIINEISKQADYLGKRLYLVGGSLRDIFLHKNISDLDFTIDGDPIDLAKSLPDKLYPKLISKSQFGTIKLQIQNHIIDIARTRNESYLKPASLCNFQVFSSIFK